MDWSALGGRSGGIGAGHQSGAHVMDDPMDAPKR
jgi:hypothetical protein